MATGCTWTTISEDYLLELYDEIAQLRRENAEFRLLLAVVVKQRLEEEPPATLELVVGR